MLGSTIRVGGAGLAGARVELRGAGFTLVAALDRGAYAAVGSPVAMSPVAIDATDGQESREISGVVVHVPAAGGGTIRSACLVVDVVAGVEAGNCVDLASGSAFGGLAPLAAPALVAGPAGLGGYLTVATDAADGAVFPRDEEGSVWAEVEDLGGAVALPSATTVVTASWVGEDRRTVALRAGAWLGVADGTRRIRMRLWRRLSGATAAESGPFSPEMALALRAPSLLQPVIDVAYRAVRAGEVAPLVVVDAPDDAPVYVALRGVWRDGAGAVVADWNDVPHLLPTLPSWLHRFNDTADAGSGAVWSGAGEPSARSAYLPAQIWRSAGWAALPDGARFEGEARAQVASWVSAWQTVELRTLLRRQYLVVAFGAGLQAGLWRLGMAARTAEIEARVMALLASHVVSYAIEVAASWPPHVVEATWVDVRGDDPNGAGLLGTEPSLGKDEGNERLDEVVGGFCPDAWAAGFPAYGGVFVTSFLRFSPTLLPSGGSTDPAFDTLFAPYAPELGGVGALPSDVAATAAVEATAQLIAGTVSHEFGHALGLASNTTDYHHSGDHPGWRMDAGPARPFRERAALKGATAEVWGPLDHSYLLKILTRSSAD